MSGELFGEIESTEARSVGRTGLACQDVVARPQGRMRGVAVYVFRVELAARVDGTLTRLTVVSLEQQHCRNAQPPVQSTRRSPAK